MKKKTKIKLFITFILLLCIHFTTFAIDSKLVSQAKQPLFVIRALPAIKDGGSAIYYGLGYQVIKWHKMESDKRLLAYEIHKIPSFKKFEDGPNTNLKYVDDTTNK